MVPRTGTTIRLSSPELVHEGLRHGEGLGGDQDPVVGSRFRDAEDVRRRGRIEAQSYDVRARLPAPQAASSGTSSTPTTDPDGTVRCASRAVVHPEPGADVEDVVTGLDVSRCSMASTVRGWEFVWPKPIWIGPSYAARKRAARGQELRSRHRVHGVGDDIHDPT